MGPVEAGFFGSMQICPAYQLSGLSVLICIKLIKLYKNEIIQKIRAKWESGLTAVWLQRDPPVYRVYIPILKQIR